MIAGIKSLMEDWPGRIILVLILIAAIVATGLVASLADYCFSWEHTIGDGRIESTCYHPAYTTHGFLMVGKTTIPQTYYHPAHWTGTARVGDTEYTATIPGGTRAGTNCRVVETVGVLFHHGYRFR